jgi:hypothetical protein
LKIQRLAALLLLFGIIQSATAADKQLIERVQQAEKNFLRAQDDKPAIDMQAYGKVVDLEKQLLTISLKKSKYLPCTVYKAEKLNRDFDLSALFADDTIHTTEGDYTAIKCSTQDALDVQMAWQPEELARCDFYLGDPGKMHENGYKTVIKLPFSSGRLQLPKAIAKRDMVLFAILKPKRNLDFFKFVFVIRAEGK